MTVKMRQRVEKSIANVFVRESLKKGYTITVNDGEEDVVIKSSSRKEIIAAMFSTDEDFLHLYDPADLSKRPDGRLGWVRFIYGNDGYDVIADYVTHAKIEELMAEGGNVQKMIARFE